MIYKFKVTAYIPTVKWRQVKHCLPDGYTYVNATGSWKGKLEPVLIVTIYEETEYSADMLAIELASALLNAGEEAALVDVSPAHAVLFVTRTEVA